MFTARTVWDLYVEYLWNYQQGSWVATIASACRVLAFVVVTPFIILTLLDVASYVIARTIGVIDDTKASTSEVQDPPTGSQIEGLPGTKPFPVPIPIHNADQDGTEDDDTRGALKSTETIREDGDALSLTTPPQAYFHNMVQEGNLKLSGVDMFSPAPSQPPSPTLSRRDLSLHMTHQMPPQGKKTNGREGLGGSSRRNVSVAEVESPQSSSGESSFAMLDKDSGSEDTSSNVLMRKRKGAVSGASEDS